jgi:regulation of enolase protein 1 (concanavalin A-like superfamily)
MGQGKDTGQYDHAGSMVHLDATNVHKYEGELIDRRQHASVVATPEYSDWSIVARPSISPLLALHDARRASDIEVHYAVDGESFILMRPTYLPDGPAFVGPMLAAPDGDDVTATFAAWSLTPE